MAAFPSIMDSIASVPVLRADRGESGPDSPSSRDIEVFNVVAVELSFRRAAERLAIDQSALSRRIRQLEEMLGYQLIRRTTREVLLTQAGEDLP